MFYYFVVLSLFLDKLSRFFILNCFFIEKPKTLNLKFVSLPALFLKDCVIRLKKDKVSEINGAITQKVKLNKEKAEILTE
jgi:hypothetical protein